eukprot:1149468-Pelagomonas_calceolata.AAC.3
MDGNKKVCCMSMTGRRLEAEQGFRTGLDCFELTSTCFNAHELARNLGPCAGESILYGALMFKKGKCSYEPEVYLINSSVIKFTSA